MPLTSAFETLWPASPSPLGADLLRQDVPYAAIAQALREGLMGPHAVNHRASDEDEPALAQWWSMQLSKPLSALVVRQEDLQQRDALGLQLLDQGYAITQQWTFAQAPCDLLQVALMNGHAGLAQALDEKMPHPVNLLAARTLPVVWSGSCGQGDPSKRSSPSRLPVLHAAIGAGHVDLVQWLLAKGLAVNAVDESGQTALFQARSQVTLDLLLEAGANPALVDAWKCSVFDRRMGDPQVGRLLAKTLLDDPLRTEISTAQRVSALLPQIDAGTSLKLLKPQFKALGNDVSLTAATSGGDWSLLGWIAKAQAERGRHQELLAWALDHASDPVALPCGGTDRDLALDAAWAYFDVEVLHKRLKALTPSGFGIEDFKNSMVRIRSMNLAGPTPSDNNSNAAGRAMGRVLDVALPTSMRALKDVSELFKFLPKTAEGWVESDEAGRTPLGRWMEAWVDYGNATQDRPFLFSHAALGQWRLDRQDIPGDVAAPALRLLAQCVPSRTEQEDPEDSLQPMASLGTMGPWQIAATCNQELAWWVNTASAKLPSRTPPLPESQWETCLSALKFAGGIWEPYAQAWKQRRLEAALPAVSIKPRIRM